MAHGDTRIIPGTWVNTMATDTLAHCIVILFVARYYLSRNKDFSIHVRNIWKTTNIQKCMFLYNKLSFT